MRPPDKIVNAVRQHKPELVGLSALLTTTMPVMAEVVKALEQAGIRRQVKVIIGGAPVTQAYADRIGADLYAPDAASAAKVALAALRK
jgi:5-methyltetrahydrofolate--homocysteine methyltransferase